DVLPFRQGDVHDAAALQQVDDREDGAVVQSGLCSRAHLREAEAVRTAGRLDLQDVGAQAGQPLSGVRTRDRVREVDDADPFKRKLRHGYPARPAEPCMTEATSWLRARTADSRSPSAAA